MNHYPEAIEICLNEEIDFRRLCITIAKKHPGILVNAHRAMIMSGRYRIDLIDAGSQKIHVIKAVREVSGADLKTAKEIVERAMGGSVATVAENLSMEDAERQGAILIETGSEVKIRRQAQGRWGW